jgi:hypothetical protein
MTFSGTPIGAHSAPENVTLQNLGTGDINISQVQATGAYTETNTCVGVLAASAKCTVSVTFNPLLSGTTFGGLYVKSDDPGSPLEVNLSGSSSALTFSPGQLTFPATTVGSSSSPLTLTIKNVTANAVAFGKFAIQGPFSQTHTCGVSIAGNSSCTITVTYTPTAKGTQSGTVKTTAADFESPFSTKLTGTGQ